MERLLKCVSIVLCMLALYLYLHILELRPQVPSHAFVHYWRCISIGKYHSVYAGLSVVQSSEVVRYPGAVN